MKSVLPGAPWLIAHKSMLGINKPNKITLNDKDYVIWKNHKGEVFALNNICPHMQAPLSNGWICEEKNTITCPFHALEFDGKGRLYQDGKFNERPLAESLELKIIGDYIWTYGGYEPKLEIPELHQRITNEYEFLGITGQKSIKGNFLNNLLINYDHNHQNGTHREMFKVESCKARFVEKDGGVYAKVEQEATRADYTPEEIRANPALATIPKLLKNTLEYTFPSTTVFYWNMPNFKLAQAHILYPETENTTKTFIILSGKFANPEMKNQLKDSFLNTAAVVVEQDTATIESLYPRQKPKIKLPNEEIMFYAEQLYHDW